MSYKIVTFKDWIKDEHEFEFHKVFNKQELIYFLKNLHNIIEVQIDIGNIEFVESYTCNEFKSKLIFRDISKTFYNEFKLLNLNSEIFKQWENN